MQNVIDKIEWMFAGLGGFLGWFFGGFDGFLYALVVFVVCDYFTGVLAAAIKHELSSEVGFKGIIETYRPTGVPCKSLHGSLVGFLFSPYPHKPQTALRYAPKCSCGLCGLFCYMINKL